MKDISYLFPFEDGRALRLDYIRGKVVGKSVRDLVEKEHGEYLYSAPRKLDKNEKRRIKYWFDKNFPKVTPIT